MADNVTANAGTGGAVFATDDVSGVHYAISKITIGALDSAGTLLSGGNGTTDAGTLRMTLSSDSTGVISVDDNGGSITVDASALDIRALTNADVVTAELSATDNAVLDTINTAVVAVQAAVEGTLTVGSHAVTNAGTFAVQAAVDNAHSADFDSGGGTDTTTAFGIAVPASGGAAVIPGDATAGLKVDLGADNDVTVTGTVTVDLGANNDVTLATLPDTAAGDLAAINTAVSGTLTVGSHAVTNAGTFAVQISDTSFAVADGNALGEGVLVQGDDGTDRKNIHVDATTGDVQVDVTNTVTVSATAFDVRALTNADVVTAELSATDNAVLDTIDAVLDAINAKLVTGTVIGDVNLGATDNAVLDDIAAKTSDPTVFTDDTSTHATGTTKVVGIGAVATPTDGSVGANDIGMPAMSLDRRLHVDAQIAGQDADVTIADGGNSITVDGTVTADAGSGTFTVDLGANNDVQGVVAEGAAVTGTNPFLIAGDDGTNVKNIGANASGHMQVDIATDSVGIGGGTQYTEDDAAAANPVGGAVNLIRADTPATVTSTDGDNVAQRGTNYGAAYCQIVDSSGNFINTFGGSGGTSHADDAAFTVGSASSVTPTAYLADETTPDSVDEGDVGVPRMTLSRKPYAVITDATSENNAAVDGSGHLQVDVAASSATVTVTDDANFTLAANDGVDIGDVSINNNVTIVGPTADGASFSANPIVVAGVDGSGNAQQLLANSSGHLECHDTSGAGDVPHDGVDSGNPLKVGAKAETSLSGLTLVADGDVTDLFAATDGVLITRGHCLEDVLQERDTNTDGASTAFASDLAAPGAGIRLWIQGVTISNSSATFCTVDLRDGAAGSVLWTFPVPATGGVTHRFDPPLKLTANTALAYDASAATTTLSISANGFKSKI